MTNSNQFAKNSFFENFKKNIKVYWSFLLFTIPYLFSIVWLMLIGEKHDNDSIYYYCFSQAVHESINSQITLIFAFLFALAGSYRVYHIHQKKLMQELVDKSDGISKNVDKYLNKAKIVFESGINDFDDNHLLALHNVLKSMEQCNGDKNIEIFSIDNTDPRTWWSDTMTGYLALLAKWKSNDSNECRRKLSRIFVCKKNELLSPVLVKTISLHSLIGFKTYIIELEAYNKLYDEFIKHNNIKTDETSFNKEVLIWTKKEVEKIIPFELNFTLDKLGKPKEWKMVKCYQSFWEVGEDYNKRIELQNKAKCYDLMNYYKQPIKANTIDIWFEFISQNNGTTPALKNQNWQKLPEYYICFIQEIISKTELCHDVNNVIQMASNKLGIEIKTSDSYIRSDSDFVSTKDIKDILSEYYLKIK